jgi:hypothetical protein
MPTDRFRPINGGAVPVGNLLIRSVVYPISISR